MPFAGLRVLSLESRRAKEMEALILRSGGIPFVAPSVQEKSLDVTDHAERFIAQLESGLFDMVIIMTGTGLAFLRDQAVAVGLIEKLKSGLSNVTIVARGPKPLPMLRELGLRAGIVIPDPNTWREIVEAVANRPERRIAVQEYGRPNPEMNSALERLGAHVTPVVAYRWDFPDDLEPLREAARRLARREFDVVLFTSSIQLDHLMEVAENVGLREGVTAALHEWAAIASVGPVMTDWLRTAGFPVEIVPEHPKMAALVKAAADSCQAVLARKRS